MNFHIEKRQIHFALFFEKIFVFASLLHSAIFNGDYMNPINIFILIQDSYVKKNRWIVALCR